MRMSRKVLAFFLAVLMLVSSVPLSALPVRADSTNIEIDFDYAARLGSTDPEVALAAQVSGGIKDNKSDAAKQEDYYKSNLNKFQWRHITAGEPLTIADNDTGSLRYWLTSTNPDDKYIALTSDLKRTYQGNTVWKTITISTDKVLDLNGYKINMNYGRNRKGEINYGDNGHYQQSNDPAYHNSTMFTITNGATLTIIDSSMWKQSGLTNEGTGGITFHGYMVCPYYTTMDFYTTRDLFHVDNGNLVIYGGTYQAGRAKEQVKSNFTWDKLQTAIGTAVSLGVSVAEYANGISAAKAALKDVNETVMKEKSGSSENDDGQNTPSNKGSTIEKNGTNQNPTKEQTKSTPSKESSGGPGEGRNQTVGEKTDAKNEKNKKENEEKGTNKPTDEKNKQDKDAKSKGIDWNSRIAEAEKGVVNSIVNKDGIMGMVDGAVNLVKDIYTMFRKDENSRLTQSILGTVVKCGNSGTFVAYGGTFKGFGSTPNTRNAVVEITHHDDSAVGGKAYIYGGTFEGYTGANIFNFVRYNTNQQRYMAVQDRSGLLKQELVTLDPSETNNIEQLYYENGEDVAKKGAEPKLVDTSSVVVRGGTFRNHYSMYNLAIKDPQKSGTSGEPDTDNFMKFPGTPGSVNLGVESYDANFIRDGRIQIEDRYGDGALVLMDDVRDEKTGIYHYRLFCSDQELRYKQYLVVYPNKAIANSTYSMRLESYYGDGINQEISKAWETDSGNTRDAAFANAEKYFPYEIGDGTAYVIPKLNSTNPLATSEELNASNTWYYNTPRDANNQPLEDFGYGDTWYTGPLTSGTGNLKVSQWHRDEGTWNASKTQINPSKINYGQTLYDSYRNNMKWFRYKVYRVDPLTKMSISESWNYYEDKPLAEVVYGADSKESLRCKLTIKKVQEQLLSKHVRIRTENGKYEEWKGYQPGELYRIVFSVDEYLCYGGEFASVPDGELMTASAETSILFACYGPDETTQTVDPVTGHKKEDYTPLQWEIAPEAGETAKINLTNAFAGLVDYTGSGSKIFDVYYQWWEVDANGKETKLLAGTDNVYTGYAGKDYEYNLGEKYRHKPNFWSLDAEGMPKDSHRYQNPIDPQDPYKDSYNESGLPKSVSLWTASQVHAYTKEICGKDEKMLCLDRSKDQTLANNDVFKTNSDTCYIPDSAAGKRIRVKAIAVNMKWNAEAYDIEDAYGNLQRFGVAYDKIQTFYSHIIEVPSSYATITFRNGGQRGKMDPVTVLKGTEYTLPECGFTPMTDRFVFSKWDLGNPGETITVTGNITLTAEWTDNAGRITFSAGEGSGAMESLKMNVQETLTLPEPEFTPPANKKFDYWQIRYSTGGKTYTEPLRYQPGKTWEVKGIDIVITAIYRHYILSFDGNGADGSEPSREANDYGRVVLPWKNTGFKTDRQLVGWDLGDLSATITITDDTTAKAVWGNGSLVLNPGKGSGAPVTVEADGKYATLPECPFTPPSSQGLAYYQYEKNTYYKFYPGQQVDVNRFPELTACYSHDTYSKAKVTFVRTGIKPENLPADFEIEKGAEYELPDFDTFVYTEDAPDGYYFVYWQVITGGSGQYKGGEKITVDNDITLSAYFYPRKRYTLSFANGLISVPTGEKSPTGIPEDISYVYPGGEPIVKPEDPVRIGYTFDGWYSEPKGWGGGVSMQEVFDQGTITENTHVYAWWTPIDYKITVSVDSGEHGKITLGTATGHYLEGIVPGVEPEAGYELGSFKIVNDGDASIVKEWTWGKYTGTLGYPGIGFSMPAGDVTVYATFKVKEYEVYPVEGAPIARSHYFAEPGETVTITPQYSSQFLVVDELLVRNRETGEKTDITDALSFVMPAANVDFDAKWHYTEDYNKNVFVSTDGNGSATASTERAGGGEIVTLTVTPNRGYGFKEWQVYSAEYGVPLDEESLHYLDVHDDWFRYDVDGSRLLFLAVFEELPTCTVSFDAGGKKGKMKSLTIPGGDTLTLPECGFYPDYNECAEFDKWNLGKPGDVITVSTDLTVTATWKAGGHVYYDGVKKKEATCTDWGITEYYCANCGELIEDVRIPAKGHVIGWHEAKEATCAEEGCKEHYACEVCGKTFSDEAGTTEISNVILPKAAHNYEETVTKATLTKDGKISAVCSVCGTSKGEEKIAKASGIAISAEKFAYNGKIRKPVLTVKDSDGEDIAPANYTASWSNASSKTVGTYTVTVKLRGNYSGTKELTYTIVPAKVTGLKNAKATTSAVKLAWTKAGGAKYYEVYASADGKSFKKAGTVSTNSAVIKKVAGKAMTAGKTYYFKVRALDATKKLTGSVSAVLKTGTLTAAPKITKLTSAKSKTATVTFGKVTGAKGYLVYKSADNKKWTKAGSTTKTTVNLTKLTGGKKIYVKVIAVNNYGANSAASAVKSVTVKK